MRPDDTLHDAAAKLGTLSAEQVPVVEDNHLVGSLSSQNISVGAVADGRDLNASVSEVMSKDASYCFETDDVEEVISCSAEADLKCLPVLDHNERVVGWVSLSLEQKATPADSLGDQLSIIACEDHWDLVGLYRGCPVGEQSIRASSRHAEHHLLVQTLAA